MREIDTETDATHCEPRMSEEVGRRGRVANHKRVRRLMRHHGIVGLQKPAKGHDPRRGEPAAAPT